MGEPPVGIEIENALLSEIYGKHGRLRAKGFSNLGTTVKRSQRRFELSPTAAGSLIERDSF